ncbi:putative methyltransferase DDB_G0268948 [Physella acuta]|uniref:putative methyltransferase DDB_G0268948 n=1 Tax=Physella acuta TaxID=109671 RepID=UPI0027DE4365|nr:putative methyltransferase DDB_G0268948 [Physella acuta]
MPVGGLTQEWLNGTRLSEAYKTPQLSELYTGPQLSEAYSDYRPSYPREVYDLIMTFHTSSRSCQCDLAVDVCCGTGQSTVPLAGYFSKVLGADVSEDQLQKFPKDLPNVKSVVSTAENLHFLEPESVDLVTVATALHWLDQDKFFQEVKRVLKPSGTFATFCYNFEVLDDVEATEFIEQTRKKIFSKYMTSNLDLIEDKFTSIDFPFPHTLRLDGINMTSEMSVDQYIGYLRSFHFVDLYLREYPADDILGHIRRRLSELSNNDGGSLTVRWNVFLVMCRRD